MGFGVTSGLANSAAETSASLGTPRNRAYWLRKAEISWNCAPLSPIRHRFDDTVEHMVVHQAVERGAGPRV